MAVPSQITYDAASATLQVGAEAVGSMLRVYTTDGQLVKRMVITDQQTQLSGMPQGLLLMQIEGKNICPRTLKIMQ